MLAKALRGGDTGYSAQDYRHGRYEMGLTTETQTLAINNYPKVR